MLRSWPHTGKTVATANFTNRQQRHHAVNQKAQLPTMLASHYGRTKGIYTAGFRPAATDGSDITGATDTYRKQLLQSAGNTMQPQPAGISLTMRLAIEGNLYTARRSYNNMG